MSDHAPVIVCENVVKNYGEVQALRGISLRVPPGQIFGLLGQNGAGKTTLVKMLLGIIRPSEGKASLLGQPVGSTSVRRKVGYLPEDHRFPEYHSGKSLLEFYGALLEMPRSAKLKRIPEVLELVGLTERMHYKIRTYSKGMKQRLGIAQALMHDPSVLFLDEPTDGVDPVGRREIRLLMAELKDKGVTIFLNSHLLGEVELICDRVMILDRGTVIRQGSIAELTQSKGIYVLGLDDGQLLPVEELQNLGFGVTRMRGSGITPLGRYEIDLLEQSSIDPVFEFLRQRGLRLRHLEEKRQSLEDLFVATVEAVEPLRSRGRTRIPD